MSKKFRGKYRIESARLQGYDYGKNGAYFVTIITKNREYYFGEIINGKMILNDLGQIARKYWFEIPNHFVFVKLDKMVVMPNHIHGIIWIINRSKNNVSGDNERMNGMDGMNGMIETPKLGVSTGTPGTLGTQGTLENNRQWKPGTLGVIINQYKRICTIKSREILPEFGWQSRFHDRIIRNHGELNCIRKYIEMNPEKWDNDLNNK